MQHTACIPLVLAGLMAVAVTEPCAAQPFRVRQVYLPNLVDVVFETRVPVADLDLASPQDARTLMTRIEAAADAVCDAPASEIATRPGAKRLVECRREAVASAVRRMRSPQLSAIAAADRGKQLAVR